MGVIHFSLLLLFFRFHLFLQYWNIFLLASASNSNCKFRFLNQIKREKVQVRSSSFSLREAHKTGPNSGNKPIKIIEVLFQRIITIKTYFEGVTREGKHGQFHDPKINYLLLLCSWNQLVKKDIKGEWSEWGIDLLKILTVALCLFKINTFGMLVLV